MNKNLLPIGTRVTHFDGGSSTHGKGTIVSYNGLSPNKYVEENFKSAADLAAQDSTGIIALGIVNSFYNGTRCPYVVHFDPSDRYPEGYKDVYEPDSIRPLNS